MTISCFIQRRKAQFRVSYLDFSNLHKVTNLKVLITPFLSNIAQVIVRNDLTVLCIRVLFTQKLHTLSVPNSTFKWLRIIKNMRLSGVQRSLLQCEDFGDQDFSYGNYHQSRKTHTHNYCRIVN